MAFAINRHHEWAHHARCPRYKSYKSKRQNGVTRRRSVFSSVFGRIFKKVTTDRILRILEFYDMNFYLREPCTSMTMDILRIHFYLRTFQIEARGTFTQHFYLRGPNEQRRSVHFYVIFYFTRLFYGMLLYVHNLNTFAQ